VWLFENNSGLPVRSPQFILGQRFLLVLILDNYSLKLYSKSLSASQPPQKAQIPPGADVLRLSSETWRTFANISLVHCFCWLLKRQPGRADRGPLILSSFLANGYSLFSRAAGDDQKLPKLGAAFWVLDETPMQNRQKASGSFWVKGLKLKCPQGPSR
jgi:hypothetical protein